MGMGLLGILFLALFWSRLFFGIDFTDESYAIGMGLRFARGARPFIDEIFLNQTSPLLLLPAFRSFQSWRPSEDGVVLFSRILFGIFQTGLGLFLFTLLRRRSDAVVGLFSACALVLFVPLNVPALYYNTLAIGFLTVGIFASLEAMERSSSGWWGLASVFLVSSVCVYPAFFLPVLFLSGCVAARMARRRFLLGALGGLVPFIYFAPFLWQARNYLGQVWDYSRRGYSHGGGWEKIRQLLHEGVVSAPLVLYVAMLVSMGVAYLWSSHPRWAKRLLVFLPALVLGACAMHSPGVGVWFDSRLWVIALALMAPLFFSMAPDRRYHTDLLFAGWSASMLAGVASAWSSVNGLANAAIGLAPGAGIGLFFLLGALSPGKFRWGLSLSTIASLLLCLWSWTYRDARPWELTVPLTKGPFAGLRTSPAQSAFLKKIGEDIAQFSNPQGRVVFFEFPAGYLLSPLPSAGINTFMRFASQAKEYYVDYYQKHLSPHNVVFEVNQMPFHYGFDSQRLSRSRLIKNPLVVPTKDPWHQYLRSTHQKVLERPEYAVYLPGKVP